LDERRVLAAITGAVFEDVNQSLSRDPGEVVAPSRLIYIDVNDNAQLDVGEQFAVAKADGTFEFPNLADGTYLLRLFNGTSSQSQTVPVEATIAGAAVSVADADQLVLSDGLRIALTTDAVVVGDAASGSGQTLPVGGQLAKIQTLPDGRLLVIGTATEGDTSWVVDPRNATVTAIDLSGLGQSIPWADVAIDGSGRGVLLEQTTDLGIVRAIDASGSQVQVRTTSNLVPSGTQVVSSETGSRTVFAWSGSGGMQLSLWSNITATFITAPQTVSATELLSFDDASGLLAVRTAAGGVSVHDVDANFATLQTLDEMSGPVAIDGARDLLFTISPLDAMLKVINLRSGELVADLAVDLSAVGQVASLAVDNRSSSVAVLGAAGLTDVGLRSSAAHKVTIRNGQDPDPILFGVALSGVNSAPAYLQQPSFSTREDVPLTLAAPAALNGSSDIQGDRYVLVQTAQPTNGSASLGINGSVAYTPHPDYNGFDSVAVMLHDGRDFREFTLNFNVVPLPDSPTGVQVDIGAVPEDLQPGQAIGLIEVIDADGLGRPHIIRVDDPRFIIQDGQIILIRGPLDFEQEPMISIGITVTDPETGDSIEQTVAVSIRDVNEPITGIFPHFGRLHENEPGGAVEVLYVLDPDSQSHRLTVDDSRFTVDSFNYLRLKPGITVDYEKEPSIVVNVTASELPSGGSFTQAIEIEVIDVPEQPQSIELSNQTVVELSPGAVVGQVTVDGGTPQSRFEISVDDSRFEIDGNTLKLLDDQFVERVAQAEIELTITVRDRLIEFTTIHRTFVIEVLENLTPYHNPDNPYDVNHTGEVTASDALAIINYLNVFGPGPVGQGDTGFFYDVNADGMVTALDALLVLNEINRLLNGGGTVGGEREGKPEGEQIVAEETSPTPAVPPSAQAGRRLSVPQADAALPSAPPRKIEVARGSSSAEFAENVDATLRLFSDRPF
jgi:hypothetical protein